MDKRFSTYQFAPALESGSRRTSRHSRQLSIATRGEGFEVMSGHAIHPPHPSQRLSMHRRGASRKSIRFSTLEPASILFGMAHVQKPLPPAPQSPQLHTLDWKSGLRNTGTDDDGEDRFTALEKLEGRHRPSVLPEHREKDDDTQRPVVPSWLCVGDGPLPPVLDEDKASSALKRQAIFQSSSEIASLGALREQDRTPRPTDPDVSGASSSSESWRAQLRPLRLSTLSSAPRRPTVQATLPTSKTPQRVSSITYKSSHDADTSTANKVSTPTREWSDKSQKQHNPSSSRGVQSNSTSWTASDHTHSLFSPDTNVSGSPGATSIDSAENTPRKPRFRVDDHSIEELQHQLAAAHLQLEEQRERHQHEVTSLQRELEEVRQVMGSQLVNVTSAKEAAEEKVKMLQMQCSGVETQLEDVSGERDMYKEDIVDWRSRCSDLEHTIQSQQLRLDQERTWRRVATKRMQAMSTRLRGESAKNSDASNMSSNSLTSSLIFAPMTDLPELPELPSEDESGLWTQRVARQLSKHAPNSSNAPELAPETVKLLTDMREQILALHSALRLEESNHALTREQLKEAQNAADGGVQHVCTPQAPASTDVQEASFTLDMPTPTIDDTYAIEQTPMPDAQNTTADILFPASSGVVQEEEALIGLGFSSPPKKESAFDAEDSTKHERACSEESLGLATNRHRSSEPETPKDSAELFSSKRESCIIPLGFDPYAAFSTVASSDAWPDSDNSHTGDIEQGAMPKPAAQEHQIATDNTKPYESLSEAFANDAGAYEPKSETWAEDAVHVDLESGNDSGWVSVDEDDADEKETEGKSSPATPRPEFIPEWSFDQAVFEAARDVRLYKESGKNTQNKYARRGARRTRRAPIEDFFGIFDVASDTIVPLPIPGYALEPPPVDTSKSQLVFDDSSHLPEEERTWVTETSAHEPAVLGEPWQSPKMRAQSMVVSPPHAELPASASKSSAAHAALRTVSDEATAWTPESCMDGDGYDYAHVPEIQSCDATPPDDSELAVFEETGTHLAPSIPAPSTPIPRSPGFDALSPIAPGRMRFVKHNPMTRIPVPTPVWKLDFELSTAVPGAADLIYV